MPNPWNPTHRGHRWVYCPSCDISMNRDANAGQNMRQKGLRERGLPVEQQPAPLPQAPAPLVQNRRVRVLPQPAPAVLQSQQQGLVVAAPLHQPRDRPATERRKSCFHQ